MKVKKTSTIIKNIMKVAAAVTLICLLLLFFTRLLIPKFTAWNTDNVMKGFYQEPENRIQIALIGTSQVLNGLSPIQLYKDFGYCSYNMGTPGQPMLGSLFLIKEMKRLHPDTLGTIVLDTGGLFVNNMDFNREEQALAHLHLSPVRVEALKAVANQFASFNFEDRILNLTAYHSRWKQVTEKDFLGLTGENNYYFTRGQNINYSMAINTTRAVETKGATGIIFPVFGITEEQNYSWQDYQKVWNEANKLLLDEIADYCHEQGLNLILIKITDLESDLQHDAVQYLANNYGVPFIDFDLIELQEEIGLNFAYDFQDDVHLNYYGAEKVTNYIGTYIRDHYDIEDVRGNKTYSYMEKQAEEYSIIEEDSALYPCSDLDTYLQLIDRDRYTVFLSVNGDGSSKLTEQQKELFSALGFKNILDLEPGFAYIGVKDQGNILIDMKSNAADEYLIVNGFIDPSDHYLVTEAYNRPLGDGIDNMKTGLENFSIMSGGKESGNFAYINIKDSDYSRNLTGLNFVVYDNMINRTPDSSNFNASATGCPRVDRPIPDLYLARTDRLKLKATRSLTNYLKTGISLNSYTIFILGNIVDPKNILSEEASAELQKYGFEDISRIDQQPYLAIFRKGQDISEQTAETNETCLIKGTDPVFYMISKEPDQFTVIIDDEYQRVAENTILVLVYDETTNMIIDQKVFR